MAAQTALPGMPGITSQPPTIVYLEVDGKPHPATDCHWIQIATCGCIAAVARAGYRAGGRDSGELVIWHTGEDAFLRDMPKVVREYEQTRGWRYQLITNKQYGDTYMEQMKGTCPHTPQWGHVPVPMPDGWTWGSLDGIGRRSTYRKHIVPAEKPNDMVKMAALCGKEDTAWRWKMDRFDLYDTIPCAKCVKVANDTSPALPGVVDVGDLDQMLADTAGGVG